MSDSISNVLKQLIKDEIASRSTQGNRIGIVNSVNDDNTAVIMIDGVGVTATLLHSVVVGQQAIVIPDNSGSFRAAPTLPNPDTIQFGPATFLTGQIIKFVKTTGNVSNSAGVFQVYIQQAFDPKIYQFVEPALPGYRDLGLWFSPDGTRIVVIFAKHLTQDIHYRVYDIGKVMSSAGVIDQTNQIFQMKTKFLFEVVRTMNWEGNKTTDPTTRFGEWAYESVSWIAALDNDPNQLYWLEHDVLIGNLTSLTPDGTPMEDVYYYKLDINKNPLLVGQWTVDFSDKVIVFNPHTSRFNVRSLFMFSSVGFDINLVNLFGQNSGIFDAASAEVFGSYATPFGGSNDIVNPHNNAGFASPYPAVFAIMSPSGQPYTAAPAGGANGTSTTNGPNILFSSSISIVYASFFEPLFTMVRGSKFHTMMYYAQHDTSPRVVYEDAVKLTKTEATFTNQFSADPSLASDCLFFMTSLSKGLFLDNQGHLRNVTSADGGKTFTIDSNPQTYLKISPGQADPSVLRLTSLFRFPSIGGVST